MLGASHADDRELAFSMYDYGKISIVSRLNDILHIVGEIIPLKNIKREI
jgi:hypothetical protein